MDPGQYRPVLVPPRLVLLLRTTAIVLDDGSESFPYEWAHHNARMDECTVG